MKIEEKPEAVKIADTEATSTWSVTLPGNGQIKTKSGHVIKNRSRTTANIQIVSPKSDLF